MKRLERTARAVRAFDKVTEAFMSSPFTDGDLEKVEAALFAVKEAFAEDTSDVNCRENAMLVTPDGDNGWLRHMLRNEGFEGCDLTPEKRKELGWGW